MSASRAIPRNKKSHIKEFLIIVRQRRKFGIISGICTIFLITFSYLLIGYTYEDLEIRYYGSLARECVSEEKLSEVVKSSKALALILGFSAVDLARSYSCVASINFIPVGIKKIRVELISYEPVMSVLLARVASRGDAYSFFKVLVEEERVSYVRWDGRLLQFSQSLPITRVAYRTLLPIDSISQPFSSTDINFLLSLVQYFYNETGSNPVVEVSDNGVVRVSSATIASLYFTLNKDLNTQLSVYKTVIDHESTLGRTPQKIDVRYRDPVVL